jgi:hypothetical protein
MCHILCLECYLLLFYIKERKKREPCVGTGLHKKVQKLVDGRGSLKVSSLTVELLRVSQDALADVRTNVTTPGAARAAAAATLPVSLATAR